MKTAKKLMMILIGVCAALIMISCEKISNDYPIVDAPSLNEEMKNKVSHFPLAVPVITDIPDQTILIGQTFCCIPLDQYVSDPDNPDCDLCWTYNGDSELIVTIDQCRNVSIELPSKVWTGSETIRFTVIDPDRHLASDQVTFSVEQRKNSDLKVDEADSDDFKRKEEAL